MKWASTSGRKDASRAVRGIAILAALSMLMAGGAVLYSASLWIHLHRMREWTGVAPVAPPIAGPKSGALRADTDISGLVKEPGFLKSKAGTITAPLPLPEPQESASEEDDSPLLALPRLLDTAGARTKDPAALLARATRFAASGADITILRVTLPRAAVWDLADPVRELARITPVSYGGRVAGLRISSMPRNSLPILAGLENGDVITSINGFPATSPDQIDAAWMSVRASGAALAEVIRGRRRLVLSVTSID